MSLPHDPIPERDLTAHHEAGHAVAYLRLGYTFRYITLSPRARGLHGRVAVNPRRIRPHDQAEIALAGPWAEARRNWEATGLPFTVDSVESIVDDDGFTFDDYYNGACLAGGQGDLSLLDEWPSELPFPETPATLTWKFERYWPIVSAIAAALLESNRMSYREAVGIFATNDAT